MHGIMPLEDILTLPSIDSDGVCAPWLHDFTFANSTVRNAICYKRLHDSPKRDYYAKIAQCMERDGINAVPIHIGRAADVVRAYARVAETEIELPLGIEPEQLMMGNGHHRVLIAVNLHLTVMRWTDDLFDSGWSA